MKRLLRTFPFYRQRELMQCGASCLWMICRHFGIAAGMERIEELCPPSKLGVSLNTIRIAAETLGLHAEAATASLTELVERLPMGLDTRIGDDGHGLSQGQRQRVLIARAVYRDPSYIFLDEATNSLDTNTEAEITERLDRFYAGRTVIISAHRLSTVTRADNIVVLDKGRIVESGTHAELIARKGHYHRLVKNQLDLGE